MRLAAVPQESPTKSTVHDEGVYRDCFDEACSGQLDDNTSNQHGLTPHTGACYPLTFDNMERWTNASGAVSCSIQVWMEQMNSLPSLVLRPTPATATSQEPELDIANIPDLFRSLAPIGSSALRKPAFIYPIMSDLEVEDLGGDAVESKNVEMPPPATAQASSKNLRPSEPATTIENSFRKDGSGWDNPLTDSGYASAVHQGSQSSLHINSSASGNSSQSSSKLTDTLFIIDQC